MSEGVIRLSLLSGGENDKIYYTINDVWNQIYKSVNYYSTKGDNVQFSCVLDSGFKFVFASVDKAVLKGDLEFYSLHGDYIGEENVGKIRTIMAFDDDKLLKVIYQK